MSNNLVKLNFNLTKSILHQINIKFKNSMVIIMIVKIKLSKPKMI